MADPIREALLPVPKDFFEQVKQALENLYDYPFLQNHPLTQRLPNLSGGENMGQRLRRDLIEAIETLNPGTDIFFRSPHARLYNLLQLHYVEAMTIQETAYELGISPRQAYRVLRRGQESIALVLWDKYKIGDPIAPSLDLSTMQSEIARVHADIHPTDIRAALSSATKAVERLAQQLGLTLQLHLPTQPLLLALNQVVAQQVFVNLLSYSIKHALASPFHIELAAQDGAVSLQVRYQTDLGETDSLVTPVIVELLNLLDWNLQVQLVASHAEITLNFAKRGLTLLVIDDNEGLIELLERYLTGYPCEVIAATTSQEGLHLAQKLIPDVIILDVMMPNIDGWEVLQRLRAAAATEHIAVVVCSVFNDPELAYSLGASAFVAKPLTQETLVETLLKLKVF